jgi:hypothetical protein
MGEKTPDCALSRLASRPLALAFGPVLPLLLVHLILPNARLVQIMGSLPVSSAYVSPNTERSPPGWGDSSDTFSPHPEPRRARALALKPAASPKDTPPPALEARCLRLRFGSIAPHHEAGAWSRGTGRRPMSSRGGLARQLPLFPSPLWRGWPEGSGGFSVGWRFVLKHKTPPQPSPRGGGVYRDWGLLRP